MANIQSNLNKIKNAVLGVDVRDSIHDGIKAMNEEVEKTTGKQEQLEGTFDELIINAGNSNAEVAAARVDSTGKSHGTLGKRLNNFDSQIKDRATKQEVEVERKRIDAFMSLSEGSTTGDAELIDIRTGIDGIVYDNAGSAVRGQSLIFDKQINAMRNILSKNEIIDFDIIEENKVYSAGYPNGTSLINFCSYIKNVNYGDVYYVSTGVPANEQYGVALLYNSSDELVKVVNSNTTGSNAEYRDYEVIIPYGIVKMIVVTHNDYKWLINIKKANFLTNYKYEDICDIANSLAPFKDSLYVYNYETINANIEMSKVYSLVFKDGANLNNSYCTYYLTVEEGETYNVKMTTIPNPDYTAVLLYNDTGYVSYIDRNPSSEARTIDITFTIPKNVNLIRMASRTDTPFSISKVSKEVPNMNDIVKTINSIGNNVIAPNFSYNIDDTGIDIIFKCGNTDFKVRLAKKGGNNLFDFYKFGEIENDSDLPSLEFDSVTNLGTSNTDWHSPFIVGAKNNIDGDNKDGSDYRWHFTGGNHQYNNQGSGSTATARLTDLKYYVNGKEVTSGSGYGNILEIRWTNMIQGYNTTKSDGTGREILQENHTLIFNGTDWKSSNELIPLEDIMMYKCFGFQLDLIDIFKNTIQYVGGSNRKIISANEASNCGTGKATKIIANGTSFGVSMEIDTTYDVGTFTDVPSPYLFTTDYGKSYFNLFSGNMSKDDRYYYRGIYKFYTL